jgi:hypothetical protein
MQVVANLRAPGLSRPHSRRMWERCVRRYSTSALLGTYSASMGDRYGHRACISVYGVIYAVSCATMHSGNFWVLMFGRVCGGVAYSLLYSSCVPSLLLSASFRLAFRPPSPTRALQSSLHRTHPQRLLPTGPKASSRLL